MDLSSSARPTPSVSVTARKVLRWYPACCSGHGLYSIRGKSQMMQIWGRLNSVNVQKVLWCCAELGLDYERIDAGLQFGRTNEPDYLTMNPNGRIPTLVDGDFVL